MSLYGLSINDEASAGITSGIYGVVIGIVTNNKDPDNYGRVKLKFPWLSEEDESDWARLVSIMAGNARGMVFVPEVDDEVLVAFEQGDIRRPFVLGALWNGVDLIPEEFVNDGKNNIRLIKSRAGHIIKLDDTDGEERIEVVDKTGSNSIVIDSKENTITILSDKDINIDASNGKIILNATDIEITASASVKIESGSDTDVKASGNANIEGTAINLN